MFSGALFGMAANKTALPAKMAVSPDLVDGTLAVESRQIFSATFLQVLAQIMLKLALVAESAFRSGELIGEGAGTA